MGPDGVLCAANENTETLCKDYNASDYAVDNNGNNIANCYDPGCYKQAFSKRYCPATEAITIDACADKLDNELT